MKFTSKGMTTEKFITLAKEVHKDAYDYSKVVYIDTKNKVEIICSKHGLFSQFPRDHLRGSGCRTCFLEKRTIPLSALISKAKEVHGDKYDYSHLESGKQDEKIKIYCNTHKGFFYQIFSSHLKGFGCDTCTRRFKTPE